MNDLSLIAIAFGNAESAGKARVMETACNDGLGGMRG